MSHNLLSKTGLQYFWGKLKAYFVRGNARVFYGTCTTAANTADKVVNCSAFTSDDNLYGTLLLVGFSENNTADVGDLTMSVNGTTAKHIKKIQNTSLSNLASAGEIRATTCLFIGTANYWILANADYNNTYSAITQEQLDAGTSTSGYRISAKLLRDNFYTESEVDALLTSRPIIVHLTDESDMPATPDANTIYMIDEATS